MRSAFGWALVAVAAGWIGGCASASDDGDAPGAGSGGTARGGAPGSANGGASASGGTASGGASGSGGTSGSGTSGSAGKASGSSGGTNAGRGGNAGSSGASGNATAGNDAEGGAAGIDAGGGSSGSAGSSDTPRGVTNARVVFDGTELDLEANYSLYEQGDGSIEIVDDPAGGSRQVLRFQRAKAAEWTHEMVRLLDKTSDYREPAQVTEWESTYYYRQQMYVPADPQYSRDFVNLLEDFHCEPCEANNLQLYTSYLSEDSVCLWVAYSTDAEFDPRGPDRGGATDPWVDVNGGRLEPTLATDGTPDLPATLPATGSLVLCRDDLKLSDLFDRWVDVEYLVKPSSFESGVIRVWIDGKPFAYDGPNSYRYNQSGAGAGDSLPVNLFQVGLYMADHGVMSGTPEAWVLYATPPYLELGDEPTGF